MAGRPREGLAAERHAPARPPQIEEDEVPTCRDGPPQVDTAGAAGRDCISGPTFERDDRRDARLVALRSPIALEVDADRPSVRLRSVERHAHVPALCRLL